MASQEAQLEVLGLQVEEWGEEILAQIPEEEMEHVTEVRGADPRKRSGYMEPWPQYQIWDATVQLKPEGARTPLEMADGLEPWLLSEGWERIHRGRGEVEQDWIERSYRREGYALKLRANTEPPPRAQNLRIGLVSPSTKP